MSKTIDLMEALVTHLRKQAPTPLYDDRLAPIFRTCRVCRRPLRDHPGNLIPHGRWHVRRGEAVENRTRPGPRFLLK